MKNQVIEVLNKEHGKKALNIGSQEELILMAQVVVAIKLITISLDIMGL